MEQEFNKQANKKDLIQRLAVAKVSATSTIEATFKQIETAKNSAEATQKKLSADIEWLGLNVTRLNSLMSRIDSFNETSPTPITAETHDDYMKLDRMKWLSDKNYRRGHQLVREYQANSGYFVDDLAERDSKTLLITSKERQRDRAAENAAQLAYIQEHGFSLSTVTSDPLTYAAEMNEAERLQQRVEILNTIRTTVNAALKTLESTIGEPSEDLTGLTDQISTLAVGMIQSINKNDTDVISQTGFQGRMSSFNQLQDSLALYREREEEPIIYIPAPAEMPVVNALKTARS